MGNGIAIPSCADCDPTASTHLAKILHPDAIFILLQHIAIKYGGFSFRDIATPCNILLQHIAIVLIRGAFLIEDERVYGGKQKILSLGSNSKGCVRGLKFLKGLF